ncbi:hypothetical protein [Chryseobacterium paridis]|uniref:Lipoprotein n=1 Tax=Chryseobacterium paridis TaxID=2800328 RepID=A0ABS1FUE2_9FLAO|nr:hypothetical protein [Chryseobacterium paridis]MBK1896065.1 hypothetical protein [Chryseobacterium paridis]
MHKSKIYIIISICLVFTACKEKVKNISLTGIFINKKESENKYAILMNGKLMFPVDKKYTVKNSDITLGRDDYKRIATDHLDKNFDSIEVSYNTDSYESVGVKEFDAKIYPNFIIFSDVERNVSKKVEIDKDFEKWISFSLMNSSSIKNIINKNNNKFITCVIVYNKNKVYTFYNNDFNNVKNDMNLFMTLIYTYININRESGKILYNKTLYKSLDSLNQFIDKNKIGIKRVPLPNTE